MTLATFFLRNHFVPHDRKQLTTFIYYLMGKMWSRITQAGSPSGFMTTTTLAAADLMARLAQTLNKWVPLGSGTPNRGKLLRTLK